MKKDSLKNVNVVMDTKPIVLSLIPKLTLLSQYGTEPKDILETVFKAWLLVEKSYIDVEVNGTFSIKHAIMCAVGEHLAIDNILTEDDPRHELFKVMCEICHDLYIEMATMLEETKSIVQDIHDIKIKKWVCNDIAIEIVYL